ncbi:MAG: hypothetical protein NWQ09_08760 [Nonlabens sp.]|nr:hypothetical protein [Nonlabens sp.]
MNLETRKIVFIQEFLKVQSEEVIARIEKLLKTERSPAEEKLLKPISAKELNDRIEQSESDFENNRFKSSSELLAKYK